MTTDTKAQGPTSGNAGSLNKAEQLKVEGNTLHAKGAFKKAYGKYTEAIKYDKTNAILYANRAACSLKTRDYADASVDASKAVELDPKYAKAWARLAEANKELSHWDDCIDAYRKALSSLPTSDLSPVEQNVKKQCESGLRDALAHKANPPQPNFQVVSAASASDLPWKRALAMEAELRQKEIASSSAWQMISAYNQFMEGVATMKEKRVVQNGMMLGNTKAIEALSNAVMEEPRVFHMDCGNWVDLYNKQVQFEATALRAWTHGGSNVVKAEAPIRLKKEGWNSVRRSLSVTVRAWIMRGFMASETGAASPGTALEFYKQAIEVLEWGRSTWKNVPKDDRGAIFEDTFLRGVRTMCLEAMIKATAEHQPSAGTACSLEDLHEFAQNLWLEAKASGQRPFEVSPDFFNSFYLYPAANALAALGFFHSRKARLGSDTIEDVKKHFKASAEYYLQAGDMFPEDDEKHAYYLKVSLEGYWCCGTPLRITLPLAKRVRAAIPKMKRIWGNSQMSALRDRSLQHALHFEEDCQAKLNSGELTLDSLVTIQ